jgi:hypothetical protein
MGMKRREFIALFVGATAWPLGTRAQNQTNTNQDDQVGQVATLQGIATVMRGNAAPSRLKVSDGIYKKDALQTGANSSLGVTFDDETTLSLTANAGIVVNDFVYEEGGKGNSAAFNIARGTVAFVASLVAKNGDMTISTPTATLGIRGTTGVVDVPDNTAAGAREAKIKLYPDADGRVGQIDVFNRQGGRLGTLTQGSNAFAIRPGPGGDLLPSRSRFPRRRRHVTAAWCSVCSPRTISGVRWRSSVGNWADRAASDRTISGSPAVRSKGITIAVRASNRRVLRARHSAAGFERNCGNSIRSRRRKMSRYAKAAYRRRGKRIAERMSVFGPERTFLDFGLRARRGIVTGVSMLGLG